MIHAMIRLIITVRLIIAMIRLIIAMIKLIIAINAIAMINLSPAQCMQAVHAIVRKLIALIKL